MYKGPLKNEARSNCMSVLFVSEAHTSGQKKNILRWSYEVCMIQATNMKDLHPFLIQRGKAAKTMLT